MPDLTDQQIQALVDQYTPEFHFHPTEPYFPVRVEDYLANVVLIDPATPAPAPTVGKGVSDASLQSASLASYLQIAPDANPVVIGGNRQQVTLYVHIQMADIPGADVSYDLQYWVFYAKRAASLGRFSGFWTGPIFSLAPCGEHQGDWKYVTVRVDASGNLLSVFYSSHTGGKLYPATARNTPTGFQCNAKGQPIVYVAQGSHSCFAQPNLVSIEAEQTIPAFFPQVDAQLVEVTEDGLTAASVTEVVSGLSSATPLAWLDFQGIWGPQEKQEVSQDSLAQAVEAGVLAAPWTVFETDAIEVAAAEIYVNFFQRWAEAGAATPSNQAGWTSWACVDVSASTNVPVECDPAALVATNGTIWGYAGCQSANNDGIRHALMQYYLGPDANAWQFNNLNYSARPSVWVNGPPCVSPDSLHVYIAGSDTNLKHYDLSVNPAACTDLTATTPGGQPISANGIAYGQDGSGAIALFVQTLDNQLGIFRKPANATTWQYDASPASATNVQPIGSAPTVSSQGHVYASGTNQHLLDYAYDATKQQWACADISVATPNTPQVASTVSVTVGADGGITMLGCSSDQHLMLFSKAGTPGAGWLSDDLSLEDRVVGAQHISGPPVITDIGQAYAVGVNGHLLEYSYINGAWKLTDLTGLVHNGQPAAGRVSVYATDDTRDVFARGANGHLIWYRKNPD